MKASALKSIALATAVAGLFTVASVSTAFAAGDDAKVKCEKSSSCKGQRACKSSANSPAVAYRFAGSFSIAFNTTVKALQDLNGIGPNDAIHVGQKIKIP